jgi:hypothetical protein
MQTEDQNLRGSAQGWKSNFFYQAGKEKHEPHIRIQLFIKSGKKILKKIFQKRLIR